MPLFLDVEVGPKPVDPSAFQPRTDGMQHSLARAQYRGDPVHKGDPQIRDVVLLAQEVPVDSACGARQHEIRMVRRSVVCGLDV